MPEVSEDPRLERPDIKRLVGIVQRRHLQFLIPLFLGWLVVWGASWMISPRYKSTTTILVEQPTMPQNYVAPNISDDMQTRLESIKQQIESRTRLLMIIDKMHLYTGMKNASAEDKTARMINDTDIELVRDPKKNDISSFTVSFSAGNPRLAQEVTSELTSLFITENSKVREQLSEATTNFMEQRLEDARADLAAQEAKVQQFQATHEGALPTQQASNLQILAGLQTELQNEGDALNTAKQQRTFLESMLEQERTNATRAQANGTGEPGAPGGNDLATVNAQLDKLKAQLADLSSHYTDRYPDVQATKIQIAKLEAIRDNLIANAKVKSGAGAGEPELSAPAQQLQSQLRANELEITNREAAINDLKTRIDQYQGRLNAEPSTEQQLADLTRNYDQSKANYDDLLKKKDQSAMATSMEQMQQGERFSIIDPPSLPTRPDSPNRLKFCAVGLGIGIAFGFIVAATFEFMDDRMHSGKEIKALLPMAVISEIPEVVTPMDKVKAKRRLTMGWVATAVVAVTILAGSVFSYLHS